MSENTLTNHSLDDQSVDYSITLDIKNEETSKTKLTEENGQVSPEIENKATDDPIDFIGEPFNYD